MINNLKKFFKLPTSFEDLMIFCIPSALFFSNALSAGNSGPEGSTGPPIPAYFFTFISILCIFLVNNIKEKALFNWLILTLIILIGQVTTILVNPYLLIPFLYKVISFIPLFIIVSEKKFINKLVDFSISSFLISIFLSIIFLLLGFGSNKFIYYLTPFPRFAALTVEPGGFALGYSSLLFIIFIKRYYESKPNFGPISSFYLLIPYIASISTAFIYYVGIYFVATLDKFNLVIKKWSLFIVTSLFVACIFYFNMGRGSISIIERLKIASYFFNNNDIFPLIGNGIYSLKGAPGYLSLGFELGLLSIFLIFTYLFFNLLSKSPKKIMFIIISIFPPLFSETYGAVFMWMPLALSICNSENNKD